ncbi:MAG: hypothetical protein LBQ66_10670 [Planctomycetaceae bacterium]|nr:hypothetical protein [Planctomycetaceae bacterium]
MRNSELKILLLIPNSEFRIPNYAQRRAGRPRSSPRRFAAIVGCRLRRRERFGISMRFTLPLSASTPTQPPGSRLPTLRSPTQKRLVWYNKGVVLRYDVLSFQGID